MWTLFAAAAASPCPVSVDAEAWRWQLEQAAAQLAGENVEGGKATLASARNRAPCLGERIDPADLALFARLQAVSALEDDNLQQVAEWARLAAVSSAVAGRVGGPAWLDANHPARPHLESEPPSWSPWAWEAFVQAPRRGGVFVNGVWLDEARFPSATPCLVQVLDKRGRPLDAWWQHGDAAPPDRLRPAEEPPDRPRYYDGPAVSDVSR